MSGQDDLDKTLCESEGGCRSLRLRLGDNNPAVVAIDWAGLCLQRFFSVGKMIRGLVSMSAQA